MVIVTRIVISDDEPKIDLLLDLTIADDMAMLALSILLKKMHWTAVLFECGLVVLFVF